jgi:hypothetical protein
VELRSLTQIDLQHYLDMGRYGKLVFYSYHHMFLFCALTT